LSWILCATPEAYLPIPEGKFPIGIALLLPIGNMLSLMEALRAYLKAMTPADQEKFAERCETSIGYLRKAMSTGEKLRESLVIDIEKQSFGEVRCEQLRPDVDWAYLRGTRKPNRHTAV
jgi:DNA-binding transcriptional regulator YdaS (Cro superfamily)